jgi:hypothetical protein
MGRPALKLVPWETPHKPPPPPLPDTQPATYFMDPSKGHFFKGVHALSPTPYFVGLLTNAESQSPRLSSVSEFLSV